MDKFKVIRQHDAMECGIASLSMVCAYYGKSISLSQLSQLCQSTNEGSSLKGIKDAGEVLGFNAVYGYISIDKLITINKPLILHWHQNHFVVLYRISSNGNLFYVADPARGKVKYKLNEFKKYWCSKHSSGENVGIAMYLEPTAEFKQNKDNSETSNSLKFLYSYFSKYKKYLIHILLGLLIGSILQLILPFLTQAIVDTGIAHKNISFVWLILFGELLIVIGRTATDFIRRWLLLHISMRINISLVSDFFIKLLSLPMSFFDSKMMGDLLQRINDHSRVQSFLTSQALGLMFTLVNFIIFGVVLLFYSLSVFTIFFIGSVAYGLWISSFLKRRRQLDYEIFEYQAVNQDRTYQFITSMQEIKLQDCEQRRRWEWEDTQADLFTVQIKSLHLQQNQEAGSIFINEILVDDKN